MIAVGQSYWSPVLYECLSLSLLGMSLSSDVLREGGSLLVVKL